MLKFKSLFNAKEMMPNSKFILHNTALYIDRLLHDEDIKDTMTVRIQEHLQEVLETAGYPDGIPIIPDTTNHKSIYGTLYKEKQSDSFRGLFITQQDQEANDVPIGPIQCTALTSLTEVETIAYCRLIHYILDNIVTSAVWYTIPYIFIKIPHSTLTIAVSQQEHNISDTSKEYIDNLPNGLRQVILLKQRIQELRQVVGCTVVLTYEPLGLTYETKLLVEKIHNINHI